MNGLYFAKGGYTQEKLEEILERYCTADSISPITLKFEAQDDYAKASEKIQTNIRNYLNNKNYALTFKALVDGQAKIILIF